MDATEQEPYYDDAMSARILSVVDAETGGLDVSQPYIAGENSERSPGPNYSNPGTQTPEARSLETDLAGNKTRCESSNITEADVKESDVQESADEKVQSLTANSEDIIHVEQEKVKDQTDKAKPRNISSFIEEQVYSFAKDYGIDEEGKEALVEDAKTMEFMIDSHGYSHARRTDVLSETRDQPKPHTEAIDKETSEQIASLNTGRATAVQEMARKLESNFLVNPTDPRAEHEHVYLTLTGTIPKNTASDHQGDQIYDVVPTAFSRGSSIMSEASGMYEVISPRDPSKVAEGKSIKHKRSRRKTGSRRTYKADGTNNMKSIQEKSKALKRSSKLGMPQSNTGQGQADAFVIYNLPNDSDSDGVNFIDSSFDSSSSSGECIDERQLSYSHKPLPPVPKHKRDFKQMLLNTAQETAEDESILKPVQFKRERPPPSLPEGPQDLTQGQIKLRGVLQSLVDSETGYINSLDRLVNEYQDAIVVQYGIKKPEVKVTFSKIKDILQIHRMFQIELADKLADWNNSERIGQIFHIFSQHMVIDFYSEYVNNYEAACEHIKECENSKQAFKDFLRVKQMSSQDRLSLQGLMLKPIQRFPQFIMIIKDLLKNTPRDHHDREPLQESLTGIENVAHQLNERKRESEQQHHGQSIISKLSPRLQFEKNVCLIRQDDMEQITQDQTGSQTIKHRRLFLMKDRLVSVHVSPRDSDNGEKEKLTYKWHAHLQSMELTTSAITPNMQTKVQKETSNTTILSPRIEEAHEDPYNVASDLTDMMHDISVLAQISQLVASLKFTYPGLTEDNLHETVTRLQKDIQGKDYQLQMLNSSTIILQDTVRRKKYVFSAANSNVKQEWCIDFLMAKYALDAVNIPSWYKQEGELQQNQPALLMKHISVDMQRTFTRVKCATKVYFPTKNEGSVEHLWVCSSTDQLGQVSLVSLHTAKPALIESFQAATAEILCVEMVEGFGDEEDEASFKDDTVWMSTSDSTILVFMMSETQSGSHRKPVYTFKPGSLVLCMVYVEDHVFCGSRTGQVIVYFRDDAGSWTLTDRLTLGPGPVTSMICVGTHLWAACGSKIYIFDVENKTAQGIIDHSSDQCPDVRIQFLVKTGVGVWVSFMGQPNISLYHSESRKLLQDFSICTALNEFLTVHSESKENYKNYYVTCLMASLGLLWIGTNIGVILTYPLPRLRDGVPRINNRPSVALHGHNEPVKFLVPVQYGPITGNPIRRKTSSILRKNVTGSVLHSLARVDEKTQSMELKAEAEHASLYNEISNETMYEKIQSGVESPRLYATCASVGDRDRPSSELNKSETDKSSFFQSDEHKYFILEPIKKENGTESGSGDPENSDKQSVPVKNGDLVLRKKSSHSSRRGGSPVNAETQNKRLSVIETDKRAVGSPNRPYTVASNLSFRSELRKKVRHRISCDDLIDRDVTRDQVDQLYPTLLRAKPSDVKQEVVSMEGYMTLPAALPNIQEAEFINSKRRSSSPTSTRKPSPFSIIKSKMSTDKDSRKSSQSPSRKVEISPDTKQTTNQNKPGLNRKSSIGTSFSGGSSIDTMRKQDSNTILVLSGGDGYKNWKKKGDNPQSYRPEEPCLLFWMYRF